MNRLQTRLKELIGLSKARLTLHIVFWVFVSIAIIEAIILVPSVARRRREVLAQMVEVTSVKIDWILTEYSQASERELLAQVKQLYNSPMLEAVLGGALYDPQGELVGSFGESPQMSFMEALQKGKLYTSTPTGDRYEVVWTVPHANGDYTVVICHDAEIMKAELYAYILRILGLVAIIAAFVTLATMLTLGPLVITPILKLRRDLARAGEAVCEDRLTPEFYSTAIRRKDEIGEVIIAFQRMFDRICQSITERKRAENELLKNNQQMEQYIREAKRITAAAADLEKGDFQPGSLTEVTLRNDELGQLARVFQHMANEVKQREDRLKQQLAELKIEIDQQKREREVAKVVQSGYFKELQREVSEMDLDSFWS